RIESGPHPDLEMSRFLTSEKVNFAHTPQVLGAIDYQSRDRESYMVGVLQQYLPDAITAWQFAQDALSRFFEHIMALPAESRPTAAATSRSSYLDLAFGDAPPLARSLLGAALEWAALLGRQTGELHLALASDPDNPAFAPEPFNQMY